MSPRPAEFVRAPTPAPAEPSVVSRRWWSTLGAVLAAGLLLIGPGVAGAAAHDALLSSDPADGAVLDAAPAQLVLTFSADQLDVGAAVSVTGPDGAAWVDGAPVVAGPTVSQPLAPQMPAGAYVVEWRSVSGDGHPISGSLTFTLDVPAPAPSPEPEPEAAPEPEDDTAVTVQETPTASATASPSADMVDESGTSEDGPGVWVAIGLSAAAVAAVLTLILLRRRATGGLGG